MRSGDNKEQGWRRLYMRSEREGRIASIEKWVENREGCVRGEMGERVL